MYQLDRGAGNDAVHMLSMLVIGILGGMAALVIYELVAEVRGGSHELHDRYHE